MTLLPWKRTVNQTDPTGFADLALPLLPSLYNVAFWLSRNAADAEDLVQETYLKALRGFATFEPGSNFKAWIFRILRNTYLTSRTGLAAMRTVPLEDEMGDGSDATKPGIRHLDGHFKPFAHHWKLHAYRHRCLSTSRTQ